MSVMKLENGAFLPTISSAYDAVEDYLQRLSDAGEAVTSAPPTSIQPIDALLISLLAAYQPGRSHVVDLASEATGGASTVLCCTIPAVRCVAAPRGSPGGWRFLMTCYLRDLGQPLAEMVDVENDEEALQTAAGLPTPLLVLAAPSADTTTAFLVNVERWLACRRQALVIVVGIGDTGECPVLAALTAFCAGSPWRLALLREQAPALAGSRLAILGHRSSQGLDEALFRVGRLFTDHFQYLDLVKRACMSALERTLEDDDGLRVGEFGQHTEHTEPASMRVLRRLLEERTRELQDLRNSLTVRLVTRFHRMVRLLAPPGSPQRWVAVKARAGARRVLRGRRIPWRSGS